MNGTIYRQTLHWTAGALTPNAMDLKAYHYTYDAWGTVRRGVYAPEDNINTADGYYARHCAKGNTGNIGHALCGGPTGWPHGEITQVAFERACEMIALNCRKYNIPITPDTVFTHREFDQRLPITKRSGKRDIDQLPWLPTMPAERIGDYLREKVRWYFQNLNAPPVPTP
jgi:hypothetical protein